MPISERQHIANIGNARKSTGPRTPAGKQIVSSNANEEVVRSNLRSLYGVNRAPCDTQLRTRLDPIDPESLRPAFRAVHRPLQRHKVLQDYRYLDGYLVSVDGSGQFASSALSCPECCSKSAGEKTCYYHQLLARA